VNCSFILATGATDLDCVGPRPHPTGRDDDTGAAEQRVHVLRLDMSQGGWCEISPYHYLDGCPIEAELVLKFAAWAVLLLPIGASLSYSSSFVALLSEALLPSHVRIGIIAAISAVVSGTKVEKQCLKGIGGSHLEGRDDGGWGAKEQTKEGSVVFPDVGNVDLD